MSESADQSQKNIGQSLNAQFAIGGVGGSGTRAVALLVRNYGCWLGDDLNAASDNLAFSFLFKRASVLSEPLGSFSELIRIFDQRLSGIQLSEEQMQYIAPLAQIERFGHSIEWLRTRLARLGEASADNGVYRCFGWKEPNTHVVIDKIFAVSPGFKYVHVVRDPLYMAASANQNQLNNWGPLFLGRSISLGVADALTFWAHTHRRLEGLSDRHPNRILFFSYDAFIERPDQEARRLLSFLKLPCPKDVSHLFKGITFNRAKAGKLEDFGQHAQPDDLLFCRNFSLRCFAASYGR
jgi:hypothetical protein